MTTDPEQKRKEQKKQNLRTALILLSVVAVFFFGIMIRKVFEPDIFSLLK